MLFFSLIQNMNELLEEILMNEQEWEWKDVREMLSAFYFLWNVFFTILLI
jgi:hypothetical protein